MKLLSRSIRACLAVLFLLSCSSDYGLTRKHVIGGWGAGFGNVFLGVLHHLAWCDEKGFEPVVYWDEAFPYYQFGGYNGKQNAWEYYFEPTSSQSYVPGDRINRCFTPDRYRLGTEERFYRAAREEGKRLIDKYVKVVVPVQKKIDDFYNKNMCGKKTIGIHLRGTDKHTDHPDTDPRLIFEEANKQADLIGECQFLVASDEYRLVELAKKGLNRPVIYYDCRRSSDGHHILYSGDHWTQARWSYEAIQGEDFLIEFILLSKCLVFVHTASNASALPFYFNPGLKGVYFSPKGEIIYF